MALIGKFYSSGRVSADYNEDEVEVSNMLYFRTNFLVSFNYHSKDCTNSSAFDVDG